VDFAGLVGEFGLLGAAVIYLGVQRYQKNGTNKDKDKENGYLKRIADGVDELKGLERETHTKLDRMVAYSDGREAGRRSSASN
jgi:hypothetical protein